RLAYLKRSGARSFSCATGITVGFNLCQLQTVRVVQDDVHIDELATVAVDTCGYGCPVLIKSVVSRTVNIKRTAARHLRRRRNPDVPTVDMHHAYNPPIRTTTNVQPHRVHNLIVACSAMLQTGAGLVRACSGLS